MDNKMRICGTLYFFPIKVSQYTLETISSYTRKPVELHETQHSLHLFYSQASLPHIIMSCSSGV